MQKGEQEFRLTFEEFAQLNLHQLQITIVGIENEYALKYTLYRVQVEHPQIQRFFCARRYNEFYALHKVLKIKYSNLDLPQFPSKHDFFNKIEKRKAGFHLLLNKLVEIAIQHPVIAPNILKLLYFFLTRELSGQERQCMFRTGTESKEGSKMSFGSEEDDLKEIEKTLKTVVDDEPIKKDSPKDSINKNIYEALKIANQATINYQKEIKNYGGNVLLRFSQEEEWVTFYAKIKDGSLLLFNHISQNYFSCQIILFQAIFELVNDDIIFISHRFDYRKIQFKLEQYDYTTIMTWYNQLQIASAQLSSNEMQQDDFNPVGKIQLHIREVRNLKNLIQDSFLLIKIRFKPFTCQTKQHVYTDNPQWRQDFIMPINDTYGVIYLDLINEVQDGLLSRKIKQIVIGTAEIQIADFLSYHSDQKFQIFFKLAISDDVNKVASIFTLFSKIAQNAFGGDQRPFLIVSIKNRSSPVSLFAAPPIHSYEGDQLEPDLTQMKMQIIRIKRIMALVSQLVLNLEDIVDQKYPRLTFFVFINMALFIFFADITYILSYIVFGLILVMVYQHPCVYPILSEFFARYILCQLNPYYQTPKVFTIEQKELKKNTMTLDKVIKFDNNEIKFEADDENEAKESLYQKIRAIKKQFYIIQVQMTYFANFSEKILNLFSWKEYHRTLYFFTIIFVVYCLLRILPLKYMMLFGIINEWFDGRTVFKKRYLHNLKISTVMMEYIIKRHAPDMINQNNFLDLELPRTEHFRNKVALELKMHLQIHLTLEEINKYNTGNEIVRDLMTCSEKLKFMGIIDNTFMRDQLYYELRSKGKYKIKPHYMLFYTFSNFIYNIPSQFYRLRRPRLFKQ